MLRARRPTGMGFSWCWQLVLSSRPTRTPEAGLRRPSVCWTTAVGTRHGGRVKTIGLLGGMSWESTALYYSLLNQRVRERLGGFHSARCLMSSVDFAPVEEMQRAGDWESAGRLLAQEAQV